MRLKWLLFIVFLGAITVHAHHVIAQSVVLSNGSPSEVMLAEELEPAIQALQLTPEQLEKWDALSKLVRDPVIPLFEDFKRAQQKLDALLVNSSATVGEIREQYRQVEILRQVISRLDIEYRLGLREILTPEQRPKFDEYLRQRLNQSSEQ